MHIPQRVAAGVSQHSTVSVGTISFDAYSAHTPSSVTTVTTLEWIHTCAEGASDLFVGIRNISSVTFTVKYNTISLGYVNDINVSGRYIWLFHCSSPTSGEHLITVHSSSETTIRGLIGLSYIGGGTIGVSQTKHQSGNTFSFGAKVPYDNGWLVGLAYIDSGNGTAVGTNVIRVSRSELYAIDSGGKLAAGTQVLEVHSTATENIGIAVGLV